jgi:hypothetical protein
MKQNRLSNTKQTNKLTVADMLSPAPLNYVAVLERYLFYLNKYDIAYVSQDTIAEEVGKSVWYVNRAFNYFESLDIFTVVQRRFNNSLVYIQGPRFRNRTFYNSLQDWFSIFPPYLYSLVLLTSTIVTSDFVYKSIRIRADGILVESPLLPVCPRADLGEKEKKDPDPIPFSAFGSAGIGREDDFCREFVTQLSTINPEEPKKGEIGVGMGQEAEALVEKIVDAFGKRGQVISVSEEKELYAFPHDALVSACNVLKAKPDEKSPKAVFWAEARRATCAVPGRRPDFEGGERIYAAKKLARSVPVYDSLEEIEAEIEAIKLKKMMERTSTRVNIDSYDGYGDREVLDMKQRDRDVAASKYIWSAKL